MNEQIFKLALKAIDFQGAVDIDTELKLTNSELTKFAELIVRECSAFVNHFSDGHEKDQFGRKMFLYTADIGQVILEHFGVEE
jgi:hypothetical protein